MACSCCQRARIRNALLSESAYLDKCMYRDSRRSRKIFVFIFISSCIIFFSFFSIRPLRRCMTWNNTRLLPLVSSIISYMYYILFSRKRIGYWWQKKHPNQIVENIYKKNSILIDSYTFYWTNLSVFCHSYRTFKLDASCMLCAWTERRRIHHCQRLSYYSTFTVHVHAVFLFYLDLGRDW